MWSNRRRDKKFGKVGKPVEEGSMSSVVAEDEGSVVTNTNSTSTSTEREEVWENLTDRERKSFRYVY